MQPNRLPCVTVFVESQSVRVRARVRGTVGVKVIAREIRDSKGDGVRRFGEGTRVRDARSVRSKSLPEIHSQVRVRVRVREGRSQ